MKNCLSLKKMKNLVNGVILNFIIMGSTWSLGVYGQSLADIPQEYRDLFKKCAEEKECDIFTELDKLNKEKISNIDMKKIYKKGYLEGKRFDVQQYSKFNSFLKIIIKPEDFKPENREKSVMDRVFQLGNNYEALRVALAKKPEDQEEDKIEKLRIKVIAEFIRLAYFNSSEYRDLVGLIGTKEKLEDIRLNVLSNTGVPGSKIDKHVPMREVKSRGMVQFFKDISGMANNSSKPTSTKLVEEQKISLTLPLRVVEYEVPATVPASLQQAVLVPAPVVQKVERVPDPELQKVKLVPAFATDCKKHLEKSFAAAMKDYTQKRSDVAFFKVALAMRKIIDKKDDKDFKEDIISKIQLKGDKKLDDEQKKKALEYIDLIANQNREELMKIGVADREILAKLFKVILSQQTEKIGTDAIYREMDPFEMHLLKKYEFKKGEDKCEVKDNKDDYKILMSMVENTFSQGKFDDAEELRDEKTIQSNIDSFMNIIGNNGAPVYNDSKFNEMIFEETLKIAKLRYNDELVAFKQCLQIKEDDNLVEKAKPCYQEMFNIYRKDQASPTNSFSQLSADIKAISKNLYRKHKGKSWEDFKGKSEKDKVKTEKFRGDDDSF